MSTNDQNPINNQGAMSLLALMQAAAKSAELRKRAALEGKEVRTNVEDATSPQIQGGIAGEVQITPGAPTHGKTDFMSSPLFQEIMKLAEIQNRAQPKGSELKGEIEFIKEDYRNKKISIKIAVTDTENGDKLKSKINIGVDGTGSAFFSGDTGLTEAEDPIERVSVIVFSTIVDAMKDFVEELTSEDN